MSKTIGRVPRFRLGMLAALLTGAVLAGIAGASPAAAQATIRSEYATITGAQDTLTLTRLPIRLPTGRIIYKDLTIEMLSDTAGNVAFAVSPPAQAASPGLIVSGFRQGRYRIQNNETSEIVLSGPGAVPGGGSTSWSVGLGSAANESIAYVAPITVNTGPVSGLPDAGLRKRIIAAGIDARGYSFGIRGNGYVLAPYGFAAGVIIGMQQVGDSLQIASFTDTNSAPLADRPTPVTVVVYQRVP